MHPTNPDHLAGLPQEKLQRLLASTAEILAVINARRLTFPRRLDRILAIILDYLSVEQGSIMLREGRRKLTVRAATRRHLIGMSQDIDQHSISASVARSGKVIFIPDITADARFAPRTSSGGYKTKSLLSAPIRQDKKVVGVINVTDKAGNRDLLQEDINYLLDFSSLVVSLILQEQMTEAIRRQRNTLKQRNRELKRREEMQNELSRMLVHDIKGPLSEVIANIDILSYSASEEQREFLQAAQTACDRAVRMAANLGTVARLEEGSLPLIPEEVAPAELIEEAVVGIRGLAQIRDIAIRTEIDPALPGLRLDRVLIERVLQNLLINALGHTPEHSAVTVGSHPAADGRTCVFFVRDQGPGIEESARQFIFEKYARLTSRQDTLVGSGLGLYFCRLAVEAHHGRITVENNPEGGSCFRFFLPS
ncbi:MAG: ATP-binding protein [Thermodesulfobacteriota bacterium]